MKALASFLLLFCIFCSSFSQAQDSVEQVATRFSEIGHYPEKKELLEKKVWFCRAFHSFDKLRDKVSELLPTFRFEKESGFGVLNTLLLDHEVSLEQGAWILRNWIAPIRLAEGTFYNKKDGELFRISPLIFQPSWGYNYLNTARGVPFEMYEVLRITPRGELILEASIADKDIARFNDAYRDILDTQFEGHRWSGLPSKIYPQRQVLYYGRCLTSEVQDLRVSNSK